MKQFGRRPAASNSNRKKRCVIGREATHGVCNALHSVGALILAEGLDAEGDTAELETR